MDINQQLEYLNLSSDILTEKDVIDTINYDSTKVVSSKGIYEALYKLSANISSEFATKENLDISVENLSNSLSNYQKAGNYISGSMLDQIATKDFVKNQHFLTSHQSLSDYYKKDETSSSIELKNKFDKIDYSLDKRLKTAVFEKEISNYVLLSALEKAGFISSHQSLSDYYKKDETSAAYQLALQFSKYYDKSKTYSKQQIDSILNEYATLSGTFSRAQIINILKNYALSNEVSSSTELSIEFDKYVKKNSFDLSNYALKNAVSTKYELDDEFKKYQKAGNYALSTDVSSKAELDEAFAKCSKLSINVSSDAELSAEFAKYAKRADLDIYALKSSVSTVIELSNKFSQVDKALLNTVKLSGDSSITGNIDIKGSLCANVICAVFEDIKNLDPKTAISTEIDIIDDRVEAHYNDFEDTIYELCEKINEVIIYFNLPIALLDSGIETSCDVNAICQTLNKISDITKTSKLSNVIDTGHMISAINNDISILNNVTYTYNVEHSLSALNKLSQSNKRYTRYIADIVNDIIYNLDKFCTKNYTSSTYELSNKFNEYYAKNDTYSQDQINDRLSKYALSTNVFTKDQTQNILNNYAQRSELSSNYVNKNQICAYALSADVKRELIKRALSSDVMSKAELSSKFNDIQNEFSNTLHLNKKSTISADVVALYNTGTNRLSANTFNVDFAKVKNLKPQEILSSLTDRLEGNETFNKIFSTLNTLILDSDLSVKLLDIKQSDPDNFAEFLSTLNLINDITKNPKLSEKTQLQHLIANINTNIKSLSTSISCIDLNQSLSSLGKRISLINNKTNYNTDLITDLAIEMERGYTKNQTSSSVELKEAFNNVQQKGDYVLKQNLEPYAKQQWVNDNFISLSSGNTVNQLTISQLCANSLNIDFANVIDQKNNKCLSAYLLFIQNPYVLTIVNRINEIITYCKLDLDLITRPDNIYDQIIYATGKICVFAGIPALPYGASYTDILNSLNVAITKIYINQGLSLQTILQSHQYTGMLLVEYANYLRTEIARLSSSAPGSISVLVAEISAKCDYMNDEISYLSTCTLNNSNDIFYVKNNIVYLSNCTNYLSNEISCNDNDISSLSGSIDSLSADVKQLSINVYNDMAVISDYTSALYDNDIALSNKLIKLSSEFITLSSDNGKLLAKINELSTKNENLTIRMNSMTNVLSAFKTTDVGENGNVRNANNVLSTLIACFGGRIV